MVHYNQFNFIIKKFFKKREVINRIYTCNTGINFCYHYQDRKTLYCIEHALTRRLKTALMYLKTFHSRKKNFIVEHQVYTVSVL